MNFSPLQSDLFILIINFSPLQFIITLNFSWLHIVNFDLFPLTVNFSKLIANLFVLITYLFRLIVKVKFSVFDRNHLEIVDTNFP